MCQEQGYQLARLGTVLQRHNVDLVAIGNGSSLFASKFREAVPAFGDHVYIDTASATYAALHAPRWTNWQLLKRFVASITAISLFRRLSTRHQNSDMQGDGAQSGMVAVLDAGADPAPRVLYEFRESEHSVDTFASLEDVLKSLSIDEPVPTANDASTTTNDPSDVAAAASTDAKTDGN